MSFSTCDLCKKAEATHLFVLVSGPKVGEPVATCWKCPSGVPDALLDDFVYSVLDGNSPKLAAMFVCQQGPTLHTDDTFFGGWQNDGAGSLGRLPQLAVDEYLKPAKEAGVSTQGKVYFSGLARYPGDPKAWVSTKAEAKALLRRRGWSCEQLGVKGEAPPPPEHCPLAPDLVDEKVEQLLADVPKPDRTPRLLDDTREKVVKKHGRNRPVSTSTKKRQRFRDYIRS